MAACRIDAVASSPCSTAISVDTTIVLFGGGRGNGSDGSLMAAGACFSEAIYSPIVEAACFLRVLSSKAFIEGVHPSTAFIECFHRADEARRLCDYTLAPNSGSDWPRGWRWRSSRPAAHRERRPPSLGERVTSEQRVACTKYTFLHDSRPLRCRAVPSQRRFLRLFARDLSLRARPNGCATRPPQAEGRGLKCPPSCKHDQDQVKIKSVRSSDDLAVSRPLCAHVIVSKSPSADPQRDPSAVERGLSSITRRG